MADKKRELPRSTDFYSIDNLGTPIQDEKAFTEIANAILHLRHTFLLCGFQVPVSIELASHEDGYRMRHIMPHDMILASASANLRDENETDVIFSICGIELRYPAKYRRVGHRKIETL